MKILAFIPLLVWMLGFSAITEWSEHIRMDDGRGEDDEEKESAAKILIYGSLVWLFLGISCAL